VVTEPDRFPKTATDSGVVDTEYERVLMQYQLALSPETTPYSVGRWLKKYKLNVLVNGKEYTECLVPDEAKTVLQVIQAFISSGAIGSMKILVFRRKTKPDKVDMPVAGFEDEEVSNDTHYLEIIPRESIEKQLFIEYFAWLNSGFELPQNMKVGVEDAQVVEPTVVSDPPPIESPTVFSKVTSYLGNIDVKLPLFNRTT
jgi:hypothetical protein